MMKKGNLEKRKTAGTTNWRCVSCQRCVNVCPTGIDIERYRWNASLAQLVLMLVMKSWIKLQKSQGAWYAMIRSGQKINPFDRVPYCIFLIIFWWLVWFIILELESLYMAQVLRAKDMTTYRMESMGRGTKSLSITFHVIHIQNQLFVMSKVFCFFTFGFETSGVNYWCLWIILKCEEVKFNRYIFFKNASFIQEKEMVKSLLKFYSRQNP